MHTNALFPLLVHHPSQFSPSPAHTTLSPHSPSFLRSLLKCAVVLPSTALMQPRVSLQFAHLLACPHFLTPLPTLTRALPLFLCLPLRVVHALSLLHHHFHSRVSLASHPRSLSFPSPTPSCSPQASSSRLVHLILSPRPSIHHCLPLPPLSFMPSKCSMSTFLY